MEMCKEMIKLRKLLTERKIDWQDASLIYPEEKIEMLYQTVGTKLDQERQYFDLTIYRTHFDVNGTHYSVINGFSTHGGFEPYENKNYGLLECMVDENNPIGWLSADDIINMINGE